MGVESIMRWEWREGRNYILDGTVACTALPRQQLVPYSHGTAALLSYAGAAPKIVATNLQLVFIKLQIEQQQSSRRAAAEKRIKKRKNNPKVFLPFAAWSVFPFCKRISFLLLHGSRKFYKKCKQKAAKQPNGNAHIMLQMKLSQTILNENSLSSAYHDGD